ncbi:MAG: hypothetical protein ACXWYO_04790 [Gaiellaceae bacterium]
MATIAVFVALGGAGYAAVKLPKNSVGTKQLKPNAVTSAKIRNGSLLKADFKASEIPAGSAGPAGPAGPAGSAGPAGAAGAAGPAGPSDAFSGFKNGPVAMPASLATIATLNVPSAGKYVVVGKAWLLDNVNTGVIVDCQLSAGADSDQNRTSLEGNTAGFVSGAAVAFNVVHEFTGAGAVELKCNAFGVNVSANQIKITAIKVGNLTNSGM